MPRVHTDEVGFALLALLFVLGLAGVGTVLAVQAVAPPQAGDSAKAQHDLATIERAVRESYVRQGAFPATLDALAASSGLPAAGRWRNDPMGDGRDYAYEVTSSGPRVRSRGVDRTLDTADDIAIEIVGEDQLRLRTNARLRMLRAIYLDALYVELEANADEGGNANGNNGNNGNHYGQIANGNNGNSNGNGNGNGNGNSNGNGNGNNGNGNGNGGNNGGGNSTPTITRADLQSALRDYAISRRQWLYASTSDRTALTTRMNAAAATITAAQQAAEWTMPAAMTGAGGLMERLGLQDWRAVDGRGTTLALHATLAFLARGTDAVTTTDDDS